MPVTVDFQQFIDQVQAAMNEFVTGNPAPFKALWFHTDDVTVFGGFRASERGWEAVASNTDWASLCAIWHGLLSQLSLSLSKENVYS